MQIIKNQIVTITIEDMGTDGEGIGRYEGYTLFVKGAVVGDIVRARVLKAKKTYGYAKIEELLTPSLDRVEPCCMVAGKCGGCQMQQLSYQKQLAYKENKVKNCLQRIGGIPEQVLASVMEPVLGMDEPYHYRNKAQYPVGAGKDGEPALGFYATHSHTIIECTDCAIQEPVNAVILETVWDFLKEYQIPAYREESGKGLVRHILTRVGYVTKEVMVCLVLHGRKLPHAEELAERLKAAVESFSLETWKAEGEQETEGQKEAAKHGRERRGIQGAECIHEMEHAQRAGYVQEGKCTNRYTLKSVCLNVNMERTNVILGEEILPVYGEPYITDAIGGITYQISPLSFYQVNPKQTVRLYEKALEYANLSGNEVVWDLYCGIGTISLFLARKAKQVYGVEIVPQAIEDARRNAALNSITNAEFFVGAAEDVMPEKYQESGGTMHADVIVVDPPRKGCEESLLATMADMQPERMVYVSCDPATLARDVKYLGEKGYEVKKVCPVDMFPMTGHVETVVLMSRVEGK